MNVPRLLQPKFSHYRTYFFKVRKVYERVKREQHLKKDRTSKGGKGWGYKDANAINDKAVYCYARYALQHLQAQHICYKGELTTCKNSKSKIRMRWRKEKPLKGVIKGLYRYIGIAV